MTHLELAQKLRDKCGVSGGDGTPVSVAGQTGEMNRVVGWIAEAHQFVQELHDNWDFLRDDFSFNTIAGTREYALSAINLADLAKWKLDSFTCYRTASGVSDEMDLTYVPWDQFQRSYLFGPLRSNTDRPQVFSIKPDDSVTFWPIPNAIFTVLGEFWNAPLILVDNDDEPLFHERFHMAIVYKGMMLYGAKDAAPEVYADGEAELKKVLAKMRRKYLPPMLLGGPMA